MLYERCGSFDHAEEAYNVVLKMDSHFEKREEILLKLGMIYKQQGKYAQSVEVVFTCFCF